MPEESINLKEDFRTIPINQVHCRKDHIRKLSTSIGALQVTIADAGLLQPILVSRDGENSFAIIDGARRLAALHELGVRELIMGRDVVVDVDETEADVRFKQIISNVQREDLNAIELGQAFVTLKEEHGYQYNEIADIIGMTPHFVAGKVGLIKRLHPHVQQCYLDEIEEAKKEKCIQNKFPDDKIPYIMNVNVLEDIARVPREMQIAAYEKIMSCEMDKNMAIDYLRELKQQSSTGEEPQETPGIAAGRTSRIIRKHIEKISRDVEKLSESIDKDSCIEPSVAAEIEALIKQLSLLCVKMRAQTNAGQKKDQADTKGIPCDRGLATGLRHG